MHEYNLEEENIVENIIVPKFSTIFDKVMQKWIMIRNF